MARRDDGGIDKVERLAPLTGVGFALLAIVGVAAWGDVVEPGQAAAEKAAAYTDDTGRILLGTQAMALAAALLLWFGGSLRVAIARVEGGAHRLGALAAGGAAAASALLLAGMAVHGAIALRADEVGELDPEAAAMASDVGSLLVGAAMPVALAVVTAATAVAALRSRGLLPVWLAWVSLVLAVLLVILPVNYIAVAGFALWAIGVGIMLFMKEPSPVVAAR